MAFRPNSILMNKGQIVVPYQSDSTQWIDNNTYIKNQIKKKTEDQLSKGFNTVEQQSFLIRVKSCSEIDWGFTIM